MRLYLVRHAATSLNASPGFQGRINTELSELGHRQADSLIPYFKNIPVKRLYASPLKRALQTAQRIEAATTLPILPTDNLIEIDFGEWDGLSHAQAAQIYGKQFRDFYYHPSKSPFPGEGSLTHVQMRIKQEIDTILRENSLDSSIAIVTHGGVLRVILLYLLQMDLCFYRNFRFDNASISIIDYINGEFFVQVLNDTSHLAAVRP